MTIVYQYNVIKNAETEMFFDPYRRKSKAYFYWFIMLIFILLGVLNLLGVYAFTMESFVSILLFSWYKDRPNAQTDIFFMIPVTSKNKLNLGKQYAIGIVALRLLIIGQGFNMQLPIWKLLFTGFIFQYYVLPLIFVTVYRFIQNTIATKY